jgi:hypothetical protein
VPLNPREAVSEGMLAGWGPDGAWKARSLREALECLGDLRIARRQSPRHCAMRTVPDILRRMGQVADGEFS